MGVCACVPERGGAVVGVGEPRGGPGAGAARRGLEVAVGAGRVGFGRVGTALLVLPVRAPRQRRPLWLAVVRQATVALCRQEEERSGTRQSSENNQLCGGQCKTETDAWWRGCNQITSNSTSKLAFSKHIEK